jgi:hypothetical protein
MASLRNVPLLVLPAKQLSKDAVHAVFVSWEQEVRPLFLACEDVDVCAVSGIELNAESSVAHPHSIDLSGELADRLFCFSRVKTTGLQPTLGSTLSVIEVLELWMTCSSSCLANELMVTLYVCLYSTITCDSIAALTRAACAAVHTHAAPPGPATACRKKKGRFWQHQYYQQLAC